MILGIDIGGTDIKFGVINEQFELLEKRKIPTNKAAGDLQIVADMIEMSKTLGKSYPFDRIGIGTPGTVDYEKGICIRSANLPYKNTPMKALMEQALGLPVYMAKDATCAICAELYAGEGRRLRNFIMLTLGTGVGGGIVIDGWPYTGILGGAAEFGHMTFRAGGHPCGCGQRGCLEQYTSVTALIRRTQEAAAAHPDSILAQLCAGGVDGKTVFDARQQNCPVAAGVVEAYLADLALGTRSLIRMFQPEAVVLGGAITNQGEALVEPLRRQLQDLPSRICISTLKNDAGVIGAAAIAAREGKL